ncbi:hypothetical protein Cch01nite_34380 [Cellulomonas chitinilytica]|uniref:TIR domain-containing protein n=1 Tax=Cellulomonas chitinilytica TaxID=398759 RepID=A0A919P7I5_9CELL|nr:toll/interleukin-1 receptor domain-containing protein [Cellulomonas chitinilytica]GIG22714.1 hypothetical protein Cch01nite_34380 [Cellulomonas chitinilytica]
MPSPAATYRVVILTADRHDDVGPLEAALRESALVAGNRRTTLDVTTDSGLLTRPADPADPPTVAVVLGGGPATAHDPGIAAAVAPSRARYVALLPVVSDSTVFHEQAPEALHELNGYEWRSGDPAGPLADAVLRLVGLSEKDRRVFVSYRRTDATTIAEQVRRALDDDRWDVFLDRYSIPPAEDVQRRVDLELADKAFVLLLESPDATTSAWVEHEIAFALRHRYGLMGLAFPGTPASGLFPALHDAFRRRLRPDELTGTGHDARLTGPALQAVLSEIERRHAAATRLRRESTMVDVSDQLHDLGFRVSAADEWSLLAERGTQREALLVTPRAPLPADLRTADLLRRRHAGPTGARPRGWVVHPTKDADEERARLMRWLSRHRAVRSTPVMLLSKRLRG